MKICTSFTQWVQAQPKSASYCLLIFADPDALASALALRKLLGHRVKVVDIRSVNEVSRPDNLAMIRYLRIPVQKWQPTMASAYTHFGILDSQPTHHPAFAPLNHSLIIDHHPAENLEAFMAEGCFCTIRKGLGATSSFMAKLLKATHKRPGPLLATALLYGIRTDTAAFERSGGEEDLSAYHWLSKYANTNLLRRISRSEYLREWLPLFSRAFRSLRDCKGNGAHASLNDVQHADLLVSIADFFTKIHGLRWIAVSGVVSGTVVVIFRGDGARDMGQMASQCFAELGQGGGHKNLARAEFAVRAIPEKIKPSDFVYQRLQSFRAKLGPTENRTE